MFDLKNSIQNWKQKLRNNNSFTSTDIDELESHLLDEIDTLKKMTLSEEEAFFVACSRIGSVEMLGSEFLKVNTKSIYQKKIVWLLGGFIFITLMTRLIAVLSISAVTLLNTAGVLNIIPIQYLSLAINLVLSTVFLIVFLNTRHQLLNRLQSLFIHLFTTKKVIFTLLFSVLIIFNALGSTLLSAIIGRNNLTVYGNAIFGQNMFLIAWSVILCMAFIIISFRKTKAELN